MFCYVVKKTEKAIVTMIDNLMMMMMMVMMVMMRIWGHVACVCICVCV